MSSFWRCRGSCKSRGGQRQKRRQTKRKERETVNCDFTLCWSTADFYGPPSPSAHSLPLGLQSVSLLSDVRNQDVLASDGQVHKEEERGEQASVHSNRNSPSDARVGRGMRRSQLPQMPATYSSRLDIDRRCFPVNCITKVRRGSNLSLTCDVRPSVAGAQRRCRRRRR